MVVSTNSTSKQPCNIQIPSFPTMIRKQIISSPEILPSFLQKNNIPSSSDDRIPCTSWEFDRNDNIGNNWISEWHLVCESEYLKSVAEMFFLVGVATGGILSGYLSDKFGRKTLLFISTTLQTICGGLFLFVFCFFFCN